MAGVLQWHLEDKLTAITAGLLLVSAALLMWTPFPIYYHMVGAVILIAIIIKQNRDRANRAALASVT